jgi:hypothetical protein
LFADLLTNEIIAELPLTGVSFTQQLNQAGTFQGHVLLSALSANQFNVSNSTIPAKCALYVDRNGTLVWGGVIWGRSYNSSSQQLSFSAREFESYFERRRITSTIAYSDQDQLSIANSLVSLAQSVPYGNIGVQLSSATSGVTLSRTYYSYELKTYYQALQDLSRATNGFDFNIQVAYNGSGQPTKTLQLGYPRIGTPYATDLATVPTFEFPAGNVVEYEYPEDGSIAANTVYALGAGSNEGKLIQSVQDTSKFTDGWALLEEQANYSDVTDSTYLLSLATGQVTAVSYPPTIIKLTVPAYENPTLGSYKLGDSARLRITDQRFPANTTINPPTAGLDAVYRIVGLSVQPGENGPERVTLSLTITSN